MTNKLPSLKDMIVALKLRVNIKNFTQGEILLIVREYYRRFYPNMIFNNYL